MRDGFALACWMPDVPLDPGWEIASTWSACSLQLFYATVIGWMYEGNVANITTAFQLLLGNSAVVTWHVGTASFPDVVTVVTLSFSIVVFDGTQTFQQLATQAFLGISTPTNFGAISTFPLWYNSASRGNAFLTADGANPTAPVMLVGHSYGGASASILASRYRLAQAGRDVRLLTFGDPKVGDARLVDLLTTCPGISIANEDDLVTALPPDLLQLAPVIIALGVPGLLVWNAWLREPNRALQDGNGNLTFNANPILDFPTLLTFAQQALASQQINFIAPHTIEEYRRRILLRCPQCGWPVSAALCLFIKTFVPPVSNCILMEDSGYVLLETGYRIELE